MQPAQPTQIKQLPPLPKVSHQSSRPNLLPQSPRGLPIRPTASTESLQLTGSRISLRGSSAMQSMESMESSEAILQAGPNLYFPVVYNNNTFLVDPMLLENASMKFQQLLQPVLKEHQITNISLQVVGNDFTNRNMDNFLKLCQNLPADVQDSEMKQICEIAKMFQAEQIYQTGISFIQNNSDPNFYVPDDKYDGSNGKSYLYIECQNHAIHHENDLNDLEFADKSSESENKDNNNDDKVAKKAETQKDAKEDNDKKKKSVIYQIRCEKHALRRCTIFTFCTNGHAMFTAKKKSNAISIGEGTEVHLHSDTSNHVARILQGDKMDNYVIMKKQGIEYQIKYVESGIPNQYSLKLTFPHNGKKISWSPKKPSYDASNDKFYLNLHGEWNHHPLKSKKNIVLQNEAGHSTLIIRKMGNELYEVEAMPSIDPLVLFTIGISDIAGPYIDVFNEIAATGI
ncbi:hypothetical protein M9Y10_035756 [Tritrichomonas musculus]|uniref:Tubby C-terminal domain-containing protein n=1 Tax=Tritrichomonas musculus TaxID=1915356 RepID=A0ABR2GWM4_9EUKA